jgi:hypothetical protein
LRKLSSASLRSEGLDGLHLVCNYGHIVQDCEKFSFSYFRRLQRAHVGTILFYSNCFLVSFFFSSKPDYSVSKQCLTHDDEVGGTVRNAPTLTYTKRIGGLRQNLQKVKTHRHFCPFKTCREKVVHKIAKLMGILRNECFVAIKGSNYIETFICFKKNQRSKVN